MSDIEESFIVLDETPSMLQYSLLDTSSIVENLTDTSSKSKATAKNDLPAVSPVPTTSSIPYRTENNNTSIVDNSKEIDRQTPLKITTLAQSFLMGDIDCNKMKSYLPSLSNQVNLNQKEETQKWENLIKERNDLKDALQRTNDTMKKQHSMVNNWQNNVKDLKENHEKELNKFRNINEKLFQQNYDLQTKVAELQQLADLSCKACISATKLEIQNLKIELANKIAMNVEMEESQEDMKVKIVAIQELFKNATAEVVALKKKNERLQQELEEAKTNANVIQTQCDVFKHDFEIERKQREEMASERDVVLADIKMLKKRNQALIDEAHAYYNETSAASLTSIVPNASIEDNNVLPKLMCPLCLNVYEKLNDLENHVQSCLDNPVCCD